MGTSGVQGKVQIFRLNKLHPLTSTWQVAVTYAEDGRSNEKHEGETVTQAIHGGCTERKERGPFGPADAARTTTEVCIPNKAEGAA